MKSSAPLQGFIRRRSRRPRYPPADLGLYHGAAPKKVWKVTPPKLPGWHPTIHKRWLQPNVFEHKWHFPSLDKTYVIKTSTQAIRAIDLAGGVEPYLFRTRPDKLGMIGMKLRTAVQEAVAKQKLAHLEKTRAKYLAQHPPPPRVKRFIQPEPVVVWAWLQDAEDHSLRQACIRCGKFGHSFGFCPDSHTILGTPCAKERLHDLHSSEAGPSTARHICADYHQLGECSHASKCDAEKAGPCPMCDQHHPAYQHLVDGLRRRGIDMDYRPVAVEALEPDSSSPPEPKDIKGVLRTLQREEMIAQHAVQVRQNDLRREKAEAKWEAAGRPSLEDYGASSPPNVGDLRASMESLGLGDELYAARDRRHRRYLNDHFARAAVAVVPI